MGAFVVDWNLSALMELSDCWLEAEHRAAVNTAETTIGRLLASDPIGNGEYLSEGLYKLRVTPLTVFYSLRESERIVEVANCYLTDD